MPNIISTTLYRDLSVLLLKRRFWWLVALWCGFCGTLFFVYLEDFMTIQPVLRAKNFRYGVTDMVIIPYIKTMGYLAILLVSTLSAKLGYLEHFSDFSRLYRSLAIKPIRLIFAKLIYLLLLSVFAVVTIALPAMTTGLFFEYNVARIVLLLIGLLAVLLSVELLTFVLSQAINHSVIVVLISTSVIGMTELASKLIVEPAWIAPIIAFFSPISHLHQIASGIVTASNLIFFITFIALLVIIAIRQFSRTYFYSY